VKDRAIRTQKIRYTGNAKMASRNVKRERIRELERLGRKDGWGVWEDRSDRAYLAPYDGCAGLWHNNLFTVQAYRRQTEFGECLLVAIQGLRRNQDVFWSDKQRIKNELFGERRTAIEVYPPQSDLVDEAHIYWLWVLPEDRRLLLSFFPKGGVL
jgi:ribosomal protein S18 acetylase RimI-like enzyme